MVKITKKKEIDFDGRQIRKEDRDPDELFKIFEAHNKSCSTLPLN